MSKSIKVRTTSKQNPTKNLILAHALKLFNERGIEYVGVREIAADLGIRVGNVTYYFPTKHDIVAGIAEQLAELNSRTIRPVEGLTLKEFMKAYRNAFENHYHFRCLFISFIQQFKQNKKLEAGYKRTQKNRYETLYKNMEELKENGYLKSALTVEEMRFIVSAISMIARFWISESRVSYKKLSKNQLFRHYLEMIVQIFRPYATKKGLKDLAEFRETL